jgi:hypothetical protein
MNRIKNIFFLLLSILVMAGCEKEKFDDISFVDTITAPAKIAAMYNITQDNSGLVTITPNGEGLAFTLVYFGDATASPANVQAGSNTTHKYAEGTYTLKLRGVGIDGKTVEATQPLTVSFKKPENVEMTANIDASNKFQVNVTAKADFETLFNVYFGDVPNEVPTPLLEGNIASHVYAATGTYTIRVVALSGGAATTQVTKEVTIINPVLLPVTFEDPSQPYPFINFDGGNSTVVDNPFKTGINTTNRTGKMVKSPGQPWGGSVLALGAPIDFSANKIFRMKVYSPRVGAKVLFKVENPTNGAIAFEKEVATTMANAWEDMVFDFSAINTANVYQNIVLIFDLGTQGDGSANFTWHFDDIRLTNSLPSNAVELPLTFESTTVNYNFTNFDGGVTTVIANPQVSGLNTSARTAKMVKNAGQPWGGSFISLDAPINFSTNKLFRMKVYSPRVGAKVLLKVENKTNGAINFEKEVLTTVANAWEDLSFDYSAINTANQYQNIVIIFELGTPGDGSANFTFLFDDIRLTNASAGTTLNVPLDFETATPNFYVYTDFDGGNATVINNPDKSGINTSNRVTKMEKSGGQPWGGSFLTLAGNIDFSGSKIFKVKVWSPRVGAKFLLKVENKDNTAQNFEKEVASTVANAWETLTFDYSAINTANPYNRIVVICDLGTVGSGGANWTWYFDDITL